MIKIKPFLIATLLLTGFALPAVAQIGEARNNLSIRNGRPIPEIIWKTSLNWMYISILHSIRIRCSRQLCSLPMLTINGIAKIWQANTLITQCWVLTPASSS